MSAKLLFDKDGVKDYEKLLTRDIRIDVSTKESVLKSYDETPIKNTYC